MGLDVTGTQFILYAKTLGVDFTQTAMIGRQRMYLSPFDLKDSLATFGFSFNEMTIESILTKNNGYGEEFFGYLGAREVHSFDNSEYEGATHLHDLNTNIPEQYKQQYSVVFDGGSLEHVFNFPIAIKNCMEMVQVGGHYLGLTPANNFFGHGFYQFSPELFCSVFTGANGYELVQLIACEVRPNAQWYSVKCPASIHDRVTLINSRPVYLLFIAKRIEERVPLQSTPQQSDYISAWKSPLTEQHFSAGKPNILLATALRITPRSVKRFAKLLLRYDRVHRGFHPRFFQPIKRTVAVRSPNNVLLRTR